MYEEPYLRVILFLESDIVRTSNLFDDEVWQDENVDDGGWT